MKYIFLSYINRSGSTFLVNQLSKIPGVCVCPEAEILFDNLLNEPLRNISEASKSKILASLSADKKLKEWHINIPKQDQLSKTNFDLFITIICSFCEKHYPNSNTIVFKNNYLYRLSEYLINTTNIYWVNIIRDPFATYASQKKTISPATNKAMSQNPLSFINQWNNYLEHVFDSNKNGQYLIQYENFVTELNTEMEKLLTFLNIDVHWNNYKDADGEIATWLTKEYIHIHPDFNNPPHNNAINKWKLSLNKRELKILNTHLTENPFYEKILIERNNISTYMYLFWCKIEQKIRWWRQKLRKLRNCYV